MKSPNFFFFKVITEAIDTITSRRKLKQVAATPLYRNAFYLMLNTAVMALCGFFFWMVVARFYTEAEVGFSSAIISAISLLAIISMVGLNTLLIRFLPHADKPQQLINSCYTLSSLISLVVAAIFIAGLSLWSPALVFITQNAIFIAAFIVFALLWTLSSLVDATFIARRRAGFVLSKNTIYSLLKIPLPILFVLFFRTFGIVASWGIAMAIALATSLFLFLPKVQNHYKPVPTLKPGIIKDMWQYSAGNYVTNLLAASPVFVFPLMVVNLLGAEQNAYFYIAWMIASLLFAIPAAVSQSLFAEGSHFEDKLRENVVKSLKFSFLLLVPAIIVLILVGNWLLLAFGQSYSLNGLRLLWILSLSSLPSAINHLYTSILRVKSRLKELMAICGFIALAVLLASYRLMPATGIVGIGYAWLGAQSLVAIYILGFRKLLPLQ
ncbi:MAG TPA: oligosaccharide flippase family protein [Dehalococcoidia bacterium]|nr:oligosaccharide flippase family protein [Dehalococcoidia bacterium]